jgi:hypothetical protein
MKEEIDDLSENGGGIGIGWSHGKERRWRSQRNGGEGHQRIERAKFNGLVLLTANACPGIKDLNHPSQAPRQGHGAIPIWTVVKPSNAASPMLKKCVSGLPVIAQILPSRTFFSELFFLNAWEYPKNHNRFQIGYFQCP